VTGRVVPDSNAVVALLAGDASVAARLNAATEVLLAAAVLGELRYGALNSGRVEENLTRLDQFSSICRFAPVTEAVVHAYAELRVALKKQGATGTGERHLDRSDCEGARCGHDHG
jgi:tRNA(fMet)-specific endonuclease VapC